MLTLTEPHPMENPPAPMPTAESDASDIRTFAASRDSAAFTRLVHRHIDMVYSLCRRELRDAHLAEDATQAVFILLAGKASRFTGNERLTGWLYQTSINCCRNARRTQSRRSHYEIAAAQERS